MIQLLVKTNTINNSVTPHVWGPSMWYMLHFASTKADLVQDKADWENVIKALPFIIPCLECRVHARNFIEETPMILPDRNYLFVYLAKMHNKVNSRTRRRVLDYNSLAAAYGMGRFMTWAKMTIKDAMGNVIEVSESSATDEKIWNVIFWFNLFTSAINFHSVLTPESEMAITAFLRSCHVLFPHEPTRAKLKYLLETNPPHFFSGGRQYIFPYILSLYNRLNSNTILSEDAAKAKFGFDTFNSSLLISYSIQ